MIRKTILSGLLGLAVAVTSVPAFAAAPMGARALTQIDDSRVTDVAVRHGRGRVYRRGFNRGYNRGFHRGVRRGYYRGGYGYRGPSVSFGIGFGFPGYGYGYGGPRIVIKTGYYKPWSRGWRSYCRARYKSFNPRTGYFVIRGGGRRFCR